MGRRAAKAQLEAQFMAAQGKKHAGKYRPRGPGRRCTPKRTVCLLSALGAQGQPEAPGPFVALESIVYVLRCARFSKQAQGP